MDCFKLQECLLLDSLLTLFTFYFEIMNYLMTDSRSLRLTIFSAQVTMILILSFILSPLYIPW